MEPTESWWTHRRRRYNEGLPLPIPIEIMVFPVLDWLFVLLGEYKAMWLKKS